MLALIIKLGFDHEENYVGGVTFAPAYNKLWSCSNVVAAQLWQNWPSLYAFSAEK